MQHLIATYGYLAVFLLMVAESACIPVPSELIMPLGGALAAGAVTGHHLNLTLVIAAGVAGNVLGSYLAWATGRWGGQAALHRWGGLLWLNEHHLQAANRWFGRYGPRAVLLGRLLPVVRTFISLPAGTAGMRPLRFGIYTTIGCIPWTTALAGAGYAAGAGWQQIPDALHAATYIVAAAMVLALAIGAWVVLTRARRASRPAPGDAQTSEPATHDDAGPPSSSRAWLKEPRR